MDMKNKKQAALSAEERMKLIAPMLAPNIDKDMMQQLIRNAVEQAGISVRSVKRYMAAYMSGGFDGLKPKSKNPNAVFKIPEDVLQKAIDLRRELPSRSIRTII